MCSINDQTLETALKPIFGAKDAHTKTLTQVRKCVNRNSHNPAISALVKSDGLEAFVKRAHQFLSSGALETAASSKTHASNVPSINTLGKPEINEIAPPIVQASSIDNKSAQGVSEVVTQAAVEVVQQSPTPGKIADLSTTPLEVDYTTQHRILTSTQALLEQACFEFVERALPSVLEQHGWDCAAALELDVVAKAMRKNEQDDNPNLKLKSKPMGNVLVAVSEIRHTAVHRHRVSARQLVRLLRTAVDLLKALDDTQRLKQMGELYDQVQTLLMQLDTDSDKRAGAEEKVAASESSNLSGRDPYLDWRAARTGP
ncbi:hypothetical protein LIA77_10723 [Sarocladium implicatum]|nr:hypothetical protein LIA77_10723 [Sarocladium implicatum]